MKSSTVITKVYRARNKKTGNFITGGHGTSSGLYISIGGVKSGIKNTLKWWSNREFSVKDFEIIEYDLVEVKNVPLQSSEPGNG